jgi:hypothetical protein
MATWKTMTLGGIYGQHYEVADAEAAEAAAVADGYDVLDITDDNVLVVPDDECGVEISMGPSHDPYGTRCTRSPHPSGEFHCGPDPFGTGSEMMEWSGGGMCVGDPLPYTIRTHGDDVVPGRRAAKKVASPPPVADDDPYGGDEPDSVNPPY